MATILTFVVFATLMFTVLQNCLAIAEPCSFQSKCNCFKLEDGSITVECWDVTEFPVFKDTNETVFELDIRGTWNNIPAHAFSGFKKGIRYLLNVERTTINDKWSIDKDAFIGLPTTDQFTLYISGFDKVFPIPKAIRDIPNIEELYVRDFYDTVIPQNSFKGMNIKRLQLSGSPMKLQQIDIGAFNGLQNTLQEFKLWDPELLEALDLSVFEGFTKLKSILHNAYNREQKKLPKLKICVSGDASKIGSQTERFYLTICSQNLPVGVIDPNIYGLFGRKNPFSIYECGMGSLDCTQDLQWMYAAIKNGYDITLNKLVCDSGEDVIEYVLKKYNGTVFEYKRGSHFAPNTCEKLPEGPKTEVRLVSPNGKTGLHYGRVEIKTKDGQWGTICDNGWDDADAKVICGMLGYNKVGATSLGLSVFGKGTGPVVMTEVGCSGQESDISLCTQKKKTSDCNHKKDACVMCSSA